MATRTLPIIFYYRYIYCRYYFFSGRRLKNKKVFFISMCFTCSSWIGMSWKAKNNLIRKLLHPFTLYILFFSFYHMYLVTCVHSCIVCIIEILLLFFVCGKLIFAAFLHLSIPFHFVSSVYVFLLYGKINNLPSTDPLMCDHVIYYWM